MPATPRKKLPLPSKLSTKHWDICFILLICAFFYALTAHDDLLETSNHTWLLLESIQNGRFSQFYLDVMAHENDFYYLNNAHYNIICYLLFALWQLPVYLFCTLTNLTVQPFFLLFYSKAIILAAFAGCLVLLQKLACALGHPAETAHLIMLAFALHPITFFTTNIMSQYDILCLFFLLASLLFWQKNQLWRFSFCIGIAIVFKFFPLLLFLPLLVLVEKRPLRCLFYGLTSLWLIVPTGLLFSGREGDMATFNEAMIARMFDASLAGGTCDIPLFLTLYALLLCGCYFYRPRTAHAKALALPWIGLCVFGFLFLFVLWHPQWLVLLVPFVVLTIFTQKHRAPWLYLQPLFFAGYFLLCHFNFPRQLEVNLFSYGWLRVLFPFAQASAHPLSHYLALLPYAVELSPILFAAPLLAHIVFLVPYQERSLSDRLANASDTLAPAPSARLCIYATFFACIGAWLVSALYIFSKTI